MLSQELPAWDALDRHVLRFSGYFKAQQFHLGASDDFTWNKGVKLEKWEFKLEK
jgi:hypothetical protein